MNQVKSVEQLTSNGIRLLLFTVFLVVGFVLWGFVFPRVSAQPSMQMKIDNLKRQGIDSAAMFYSEHPSSFSPPHDSESSHQESQQEKSGPKN